MTAEEDLRVVRNDTRERSAPSVPDCIKLKPRS